MISAFARRLSILALLSASPLSVASSQGGGCFGTWDGECVMLRATVGRGATQQQSVRAIVLWRQPIPAPSDTAQWAALLERWRADGVVARRRGFSLGGGSDGAYASVAFSFVPNTVRVDSMFIAGERLALSARDTVLVVLVDQLMTAAREPKVEHVLRIATEGLPPFPFRQWIEGDSIVSTGSTEAEAWQNRLLERAPIVREYLRRAP